MVLSILVSEPVVLGKPFRIQGVAVNHGDVPREVRIDPGEINLELKTEEATGVRRGGFDNGWRPDQWRRLVVVPPGKTVPCFDGMVPTGLRWGAGCILARGEARVSWRGWIRKGQDPYEYESETVRSKPFEIHLKAPRGGTNVFVRKGLQVLVEAVKRQVASRDDVSFIVKLKNVSQNPIKIFGREKFDDNYCNFLIYAPGDQVPISEVVHWPTKGTKGFIIPPGKTAEREFKAAWGVRDILVPGPDEHIGHEPKETTFITNGAHAIVVYFHGEDHAEGKEAWQGYARSNVVTVDVIDQEKD